MKSDKEGDFDEFGKKINAYFNPNEIANVLSLHKMAKKIHITYDSKDRGVVSRYTLVRESRNSCRMTRAYIS